MAKVSGIGGVFFRAREPQKLAEWYQTHLGISPAPTDMTTAPWISEAGVTVFAPFPEDTDYFPQDRAFMLNFRVADLGTMLADLGTAGIEILKDETIEGLGRFAHIHDPEGNPIELWERLAPET